MANNFDSTLINSVLSQTAITGLAGKIAYARAFSTDFSNELRGVNSMVVTVPVVTAGSTVATGTITDYETSSTTVSACAVSLTEVNTSFSISPTDVNSGSRLANLAGRNLADFQSKIEAIIFANVTEAKFGTASTGLSSIVPGALSVANIHTAWSLLPGPAATKVLVLKTGEMVLLLPSDLNSFDVTKQRSGYGFGIVESTDYGFSYAQSQMIGFAAQPSALAMASALPAYMNPLQDVVDMQVFELPDIGISVISSVWISTKTRALYGSYTTLFGCNAADRTALKLIHANA